ncbi:MAG: hypothetical protein FJY37_20495 [Betaproteobacteria bacterium]|nr:hypothetical protein [Betaproteobacteria bacterium]
MTRIKVTQTLSAAALIAAFASAAHAADVSNIQGRAPALNSTPVQQVLLTGKSAAEYVGRAAPVGYSKAAARFVGAPSGKGITQNVVAQRQGRA